MGDCYIQRPWGTPKSHKKQQQDSGGREMAPWSLYWHRLHQRCQSSVLKLALQKGCQDIGNRL